MSDRRATLEPNELAPTLEPLMEGDAGGEEFRAALDRLRAMRFRFVQLSATQPGLRPRELDQSARRDLLATLRRRELSVAGLDFWIPPQHFLQSHTSDRALNAVSQAIELAADFGRVSVSMNLPTRNDNDAQAMLAEVAQNIAALADKYGVMIADHSAPDPVAAEGSIGIGIDPAAWLSHGKDPTQAVLGHASHLISVRLCDLLHGGLRAPLCDRHEGQLDVAQYRVAISVAGYQRPIVVDARQWADPWTGLEQSRSVWLRDQMPSPLQ